VNPLEMNVVGKWIRAKRKECGLRLEDLADERISTATVSNIERGVPHVNQEKVIYLMEKLDLDMRNLPQMMEKQHKRMESIHLKFIGIEMMIQLGDVPHALTALARVSEELPSQYTATIHSLKGKCYILTKNWRKAERELAESIRLILQDPYAMKVHLEAMNYYQFAYCRSMQNDWEQAFGFVEQGLASFRPHSNHHDQILYTLMIQRVICLQKLARTDEALQYLEELWTHISHIHNQDVLINMHAIRADLLQRMKLHHDAIRYAKEGIQLAVHGSNPDEMCKLWMILGHVYMEQSELGDAETCFQFALDLSERVSDPHHVVHAYAALGKLYFLQEKWEQAGSMLKLALKLAEKQNEPVSFYHSLMLTGKLLKKRNHFDEAVPFFQQAIKLAEEYRWTDEIFQGYYELAHSYEQLRDTQTFKQTTEKMYLAQRQIEQRLAKSYLIS
jgi:tetratricopeptide (TPR) repeat protein